MANRKQTDEFYRTRRASFTAGPAYWNRYAQEAANDLGEATHYLTYAVEFPRGDAPDHLDVLLDTLSERGFSTQRREDVHISLLTLGRNVDRPSTGHPRAPIGIELDALREVRDRIAGALRRAPRTSIEMGPVAPVGNVLTARIRDWTPMSNLAGMIWDKVPEVAELTTHPRNPRVSPLLSSGWGLAVLPNLAYLDGSMAVEDVLEKIADLEESSYARFPVGRVVLNEYTIHPEGRAEVTTDPGAQANQFWAFPHESISLKSGLGLGD